MEHVVSSRKFGEARHEYSRGRVLCDCNEIKVQSRLVIASARVLQGKYDVIVRI